MKVVKLVFKVNEAEYIAVLSSLVRHRLAHTAESDTFRYYVTVICPTAQAELTVSQIAESLQLHPSKFTEDAPVSLQQLQANQRPVQDQGLIGK